MTQWYPILDQCFNFVIPKASAISKWSQIWILSKFVKNLCSLKAHRHKQKSQVMYQNESTAQSSIYIHETFIKTGNKSALKVSRRSQNNSLTSSLFPDQELHHREDFLPAWGSEQTKCKLLCDQVQYRSSASSSVWNSISFISTGSDDVTPHGSFPKITECPECISSPPC